MQKVLSNDLWKTVRFHARRAPSRKAAIAFATRDLMGLRAGDVLVVNASKAAIANGETDAELLRKLERRKVRLYNCGDLHAKILLLGDVAVVSSGNMSNSSENRLVEAGVLTDQTATVAGVASFIEQLVQRSEELRAPQIARLCKIKVIRRGGDGFAAGRRRSRTRIGKFGSRMWLTGVFPSPRDPPPREQRLITKAERRLREELEDKGYDQAAGRGLGGRNSAPMEFSEVILHLRRIGGRKRPLNPSLLEGE